MIFKNTVDTGIGVLVNSAVKHLKDVAIEREIEQQRAVFNDELQVTNVLTPAQERAKEKGEVFEPDQERANRHARISLESGIGIRLKGAYACYQAGMQLECLRHILLAINTVFWALGWKKASAYIDQQNRVLMEMAKEEESV